MFIYYFHNLYIASSYTRVSFLLEVVIKLVHNWLCLSYSAKTLSRPDNNTKFYNKAILHQRYGDSLTMIQQIYLDICIKYIIIMNK